jgi:hypothetical protein
MSCSCIRKEFQGYFQFPEIDNLQEESTFSLKPASSPPIVDRITSGCLSDIHPVRNSSSVRPYSLYPKPQQRRELIDPFIHYFTGFHNNNSLSVLTKQNNLTELVISCSFNLLEK